MHIHRYRGIIEIKIDEATMKECPRCGKKFNLLQRMVGDAKEHALTCAEPERKTDLTYLAVACRGCPAGCYEKAGREDST